jgi:hypothetical protein
MTITMTLTYALPPFTNNKLPEEVQGLTACQCVCGCVCANVVKKGNVAFEMIRSTVASRRSLAQDHNRSAERWFRGQERGCQLVPGAFG